MYPIPHIAYQNVYQRGRHERIALYLVILLDPRVRTDPTLTQRVKQRVAVLHRTAGIIDPRRPPLSHGREEHVVLKIQIVDQPA